MMQRKPLKEARLTQGSVDTTEDEDGRPEHRTASPGEGLASVL